MQNWSVHYFARTGDTVRSEFGVCRRTADTVRGHRLCKLRSAAAAGARLHVDAPLRCGETTRHGCNPTEPVQVRWVCGVRESLINVLLPRLLNASVSGVEVGVFVPEGKFKLRFCVSQVLVSCQEGALP